MKYNRHGDEALDNDKVFAEHIDGSRQNVYYVLTYNNSLYDPKGPESHRERVLNHSLRKTSKKTFEYYINYLQTNNPIYLRRAERSFIDG